MKLAVKIIVLAIYIFLFRVLTYKMFYECPWKEAFMDIWDAIGGYVVWGSIGVLFAGGIVLISLI